MGTNLGQHGHVPDLLLMLGGIVKVLESSNAEKKSVKSLQDQNIVGDIPRSA